MQTPQFSIKVKNLTDYTVKNVTSTPNRLTKLYDVNIETLQNGEFLYYDASDNMFKFKLINQSDVQLANTSSGGGSLTDNISTNSTFYPVFANTSTGTLYPTVSSTKLTFNPSTGTINAVIFNSLSDIIFKNNISIIYDSTNILEQINGVEYDWSETGIHSSGVIAQELEQILPFLVDTTTEGKKSVNYNGLIAYLIQAIKVLEGT